MVHVSWGLRRYYSTTVPQASGNTDLRRFYVPLAMGSVTKELNMPKIDWQQWQ